MWTSIIPYCDPFGYSCEHCLVNFLDRHADNFQNRWDVGDACSLVRFARTIWEEAHSELGSGTAMNVYSVYFSRCSAPLIVPCTYTVAPELKLAMT